jgi:hypothetical protein
MVGGQSFGDSSCQVFQGFLKALDSLSINPERYPFAAEIQEFPFEVRELHYRAGRKTTHRALFTIRADIVFVFTIRHVSQRNVSVDDLD